MALPLLVLWLLVANPEIDLLLEHHPGHFWLVMGIAALSVVFSLLVSRAATRHDDARLCLVSLAFLASAGFLFLHALATPGVLLAVPNTGFTIATPVGLFIASIFAALSSLELSPRASASIVQRFGVLRGVLIAVMIGWGTASLLELGPLSGIPDEREVRGPLVTLAVVTVLLFALAAFRYYRLFRERPVVMLIAMITAFTLLAEAMITVVEARAWSLSWWLWHVLLALGFGFVVYSAQVEYRREASHTGLFTSVAMKTTLEKQRAEYGAALESLAGAMRKHERGGWSPDELSLVTSGLTARFGLSEGQVEVLGRAAEALANERNSLRRLAALAGIGRDTRLTISEEEFLKGAIDRLRHALGTDALRVGLVREGTLSFSQDLSTTDLWIDVDEPVRQRAVTQALETSEIVEVLSARLLVLPLSVRGKPAGVVEVYRPAGSFADRDRWTLQSLASQLSVALENTRLYVQIDSLFRQYMSPDVATTLLADPDQAKLGGAVVEVTALFADLRGFTSFSEHSAPEEVVEMLNRYFGEAVPVVLENGGTVVQFIGDALMALFNAPARQSEHALRAARAALDMQQSIASIAAQHAGWPRFRIGINTGPALVGNIGSAELRNFNAMGDAINVAARLESLSTPGWVVIGESTYEHVRDIAEVDPMGPVEVHNREEPVVAYQLRGLRTP